MEEFIDIEMPSASKFSELLPQRFGLPPSILSPLKVLPYHSSDRLGILVNDIEGRSLAGAPHGPLLSKRCQFRRGHAATQVAEPQLGIVKAAPLR